MRTIEQKLECLKKAINNSREHAKSGDPTKIYSQYIRYSLDEFRYINFYTSVKASDLDRKDVIHDHVIPHSFVMGRLLELEPLTNENILLILKKFYIICKITKEEDKRLNAAGLRSKMPPDWNEKTDSAFARYEHKKVKILIIKK